MLSSAAHCLESWRGAHRRLFNIAVDEGWLRSPFTRAVSRNLIHDGNETPDPIKTRELTDEEAVRVIKALDTAERRHTLPVFIAAMDTAGTSAKCNGGNIPCGPAMPAPAPPLH